MRGASGLGVAVAVALVVVVVGGVAGGEGSARADEGREKAMCAAKYQSAQRLRADGKLTLARADLLRCAEPACPAFVSNDCKTWLAEVEAELPTLVFAVLDASGGDVPGAVIRVDGAVVPGATDGLGHALDPGTHVVEASARGESLRQQVILRVGEKSRRIELRLAAPAPPQSGSGATSTVSPSAVDNGRPPTGAYVLGVVGVAGVALGTVLWVTGSNAASAYNRDCESTGCSSGQRDNARNQLVAGDIAWAVGLAASIGVVAVVLLHHGDGGATTSVSLGPSGVRLQGVF